MKTLTDYVIPLSGLSQGLHRFDFKVDWKFFDQIEDSAIDQGSFEVEIDLDKQHDHMIAMFNIQGTLDTNCDRCTAPIALPINGEQTLIVKFAEDEERESDDPDVVYLHTETHRWNVADLIYEFILLAVPVSHTYDCESETHPPCDEDALRHLNEEEDEAEQEGNPFRDALKDFELKN